LDPALTQPNKQQKRNKCNVDLRETSWKEGYVVGKSPQIIDYSPGTFGKDSNGVLLITIIRHWPMRKIIMGFAHNFR
jgi:hypothetical protein